MAISERTADWRGTSKAAKGRCADHAPRPGIAEPMMSCVPPPLPNTSMFPPQYYDSIRPLENRLIAQTDRFNDTLYLLARDLKEPQSQPVTFYKTRTSRYPNSTGRSERRAALKPPPAGQISAPASTSRPASPGDFDREPIAMVRSICQIHPAAVMMPRQSTGRPKAARPSQAAEGWSAASSATLSSFRIYPGCCGAM